MKQQVSLPGFAVPSHTSSAPATEHAAGLAAPTAHAPDAEPAKDLAVELATEMATEISPDRPVQPVQEESPPNMAATATDDLPLSEAEQAALDSEEEIPALQSKISPETAPAPAPVSAPVSAQASAPTTMGGGTSEQDDWPPMAEMLQSFFVFEPTIAQPEPITVMGLDCARPRGLAGLAEAQRQLAEQADVICAGRALLEEFSGRSLSTDADTTESAHNPDSQYPALKARLLPLSTPLEPVLTRLSQLRAAGERVLVLADGDPLLFGIGATLVRRLGPTSVRLLPAVSSLQQACA